MKSSELITLLIKLDLECGDIILPSFWMKMMNSKAQNLL